MQDDNVEGIIESYRWKGMEGLYRPAYGRGSIADIPGALLQSQGINGKKSSPELLRHISEPADHTVFILIDGLGHSTLQYAINSHRVSNLKGFMEESIYVPATSIFPSTTSTATVTLHTGMDPEEHGIIGYIQYLKDVGSVCNMISLSPLGLRNRSLVDSSKVFSHIYRHGTIHEKMSGEGTDSFLYMPYNIRNSGLTRITGKGSILRPYHSLSHMFTALKNDILSTGRRSFHFCYISTVDTISHKIGPYTQETAEDIDSIFYFIRHVLGENVAGSGTTVTISADHGHTVVNPDRIDDLSMDRILKRMMISPATGDERAPFIRVRETQDGDFLAHIEKRYPGHTAVSSRQLREGGFFGRASSTGLDPDLFSDYTIIPAQNSGIIDTSLSALDPEWSNIDMIGMHGGFSLEEIIVPIITRKF